MTEKESSIERRVDETLQVSGMSCSHCVAAVRQTLAGLDGVEVNAVEIGAAEVTYDPGLVPKARIATALDAAGYPLAT